MINHPGWSFSSLIKSVLLPIAKGVRAYLLDFLGVDGQEIECRLSSIEALQIVRHGELQDGLSALSARHSELLDSIEMLSTRCAKLQESLSSHPAAQARISSEESSATYISNGLIDVGSYLELAMRNEKMEFSDFKAEYENDGWYVLFERLFRGSENQICNRQSVYIGYLVECYSRLRSKNPQGYFLDFGSGRGEFLSLIANANMPGKGVETNRLNVEYVRDKGLDVVFGDGIEYLREIQNDSLYGVTMYQVAEHLEFDLLVEFMSISYEKLMPGGLFVIETVNPSCIRAMQYFYVDPTHVRPYPPELLKFRAEWEGFVNNKIIFYIPISDSLPVEDQTNYIGYALIGYKPDAKNTSKTLNVHVETVNAT